MIMMGDRKRMVASILASKKEPDQEAGLDSLHACAEELVQAVHDKDVPGVVSALKAIFQEMDSEPHAEGPHIDGE